MQDPCKYSTPPNPTAHTLSICPWSFLPYYVVQTIQLTYPMIYSVTESVPRARGHHIPTGPWPHTQGPSHLTVSVLGREEGYTVKYGLSPRAQALFYSISRLES